MANETTPAEGDGDNAGYELLRKRLARAGDDLRVRLDTLDQLRRETFGGVGLGLVATERVTTDNNCVPRDLAPIGDRFLFGFNVQLHLRSQTRPSDVFTVFRLDPASGELQPAPLADLLVGGEFERDFADLYKYYKAAAFVKFSMRGPYLYALFRIGATTGDVKAFKWLMKDDGPLEYLDSRSAHEVTTPPQHEFEWTRATRDMHRPGRFPHISIADRVFVETTGGDLTVKIEDNTETGVGIYAEPVEHRDQTLDDAEIHYALVGNLILLRVKPYQENFARHIVYSEKVKQARRIDALAGCCVQLPEDHGLVFPNGYFLQTGEFKEFDFTPDGFEFRRRLASPNGEDTLFVFHNPSDGRYVLLLYNLIERQCRPPIIANGFSLFADGTLLCMRAQTEPVRIHTVQRWTTPCHAIGREPPLARPDSPLARHGNRETVRALAAARVLTDLASRDDAYDGLYVDLVHETTAFLDAYAWLAAPDVGALAEPVHTLRDAAQAAIAEFEKAVRRRRHAAATLDAARDAVDALLSELARAPRESADDHVRALERLRRQRGELLVLKDVPCLNPEALAPLETALTDRLAEWSHSCAECLANPAAFDPYLERAEALRVAASECAKGVDARALEDDVNALATDLELLLDVVNSLDVDDATLRTAMLDGLSRAQADTARARSAARARRSDLAEREGRVEFAARLRVLSASVAGALDVCDTPERCEEQLARLLVQVEELEGRFGEYEGFVEELAAKRSEIEAAFSARRLQRVEERNRRAESLHRAADRILKGIAAKAESLDDPADLRAYFAGDAMVARVRALSDELRALGDAVKSGDLDTRLKRLSDDGLRQARERRELALDGPGLTRMGRHVFSINRQPFGIVFVRRGDDYCLHLTGTGYFDVCADPEILAARDYWDRETPAESPTTYRAEYLAHLLFNALGHSPWPSLSEAARRTPEEWLPTVREFMAPRYEEGYVKGVHDLDAARILSTLCQLSTRLGLLRHAPDARALARLAWARVPENERRAAAAFARVCARACRAFPSHSGERRPATVFAVPASDAGGSASGSVEVAEGSSGIVGITAGVAGNDAADPSSVKGETVSASAAPGSDTSGLDLIFPDALIARLTEPLLQYAALVGGFALDAPARAARYLAEWLAALPESAPAVGAPSPRHPVGAAAHECVEALRRSLSGPWSALADALRELHDDPAAALAAARLWIREFLRDAREVQAETDAVGTDSETTAHATHPSIPALSPAALEEAACLLLLGADETPGAESTLELTDLAGQHPRIREGRLTLDYDEFIRRLERHHREDAPRFAAFRTRKLALAEAATRDLRTDELRATALSSFVRNQLIDTVYLPLIGDNLAKQIGAAGSNPRVDRMGLLLLVSPPGYGKTTLMEYIAARLGLAFVKINGPALGHRVTSLDPAEAPNATSREELRRLALSLEMADNTMLYLDDIQHCNPEFLQKFIPLCDAQRRVEAVRRGQPQTFDLRGKRFAIVMAGNPYTESGQAFRIPDMLANRADTYNLGDLLGGHEAAFRLSYIENAAGANATLAPIAARDPADLRLLAREADGGQPAELSAPLEHDVRADALSVLRKLLRVRSVLLAVNRAYIDSAAQADEYRREPPFKLQGSYRNMARLAEKVPPAMNDEELETLLVNHYEQEAQTLAGDAEANLLKFHEIRGPLNPDQETRWDEIKRGFLRANALRGADEGDRVAQAVMQLGYVREAVEAVAAALGGGAGARRETRIALSEATLDRLRATFSEVGAAVAGTPARLADDSLERVESALAALGKLLSSASVLSAKTVAAARPAALTLSDEGAARLAHEIAYRFTEASAELAAAFRAALPNKKVYQVRLPAGTLRVIETQHQQLREWAQRALVPGHLPAADRETLLAVTGDVLKAYQDFYEQIKDCRNNDNEPLVMD